MTNNQEVLKTETHGAVAVLTIQRSARRNSMDQALIDDLKHAFLRLDRDPQIKAIVLRGDQQGFCAGSDLKFISELSLEDMARFEQETGDMARLIGFLATPVVAAVEGFAIGGGFILAVSCDVVVAGRNSRWSLPEVPHGWLTPWGIGALVQRVGFVRARNLSFCLEELNGEQAVSIGVADYVAEDGAALERALQLAGKLAALPQTAVASTKRFFSNYTMQQAETMDFEANRVFAENCSHPAALATLNKHRG